MISKSNREQSGLEQALMEYISKNICCVTITARIHLPQDDSRPKRWRTSVLECLRIIVSTVTIFPRNKLFKKGNVLRHTDRGSSSFRIFV